MFLLNMYILSCFHLKELASFLVKVMKIIKINMIQDSNNNKGTGQGYENYNNQYDSGQGYGNYNDHYDSSNNSGH